MDSFLQGVRVVDMTFGLAGPFATTMLAEAGADVIKVEPPAGDPTRALPGFATWNRSKRGVVVDLRSQADRAMLGDLLATTDVLVHGLRPSVAASHQLDDATLASRYPALIISSVLGYPRGHADAERAGHEILVQARSGLMDEFAALGGEPGFLRFPVASWAASFLTVSGILARLIARAETGRVGPAHTSLYQGVLATFMMIWHEGDRITPEMATKAGLPKGGGPGRMTMECADGQWLQLVSGGFIEHPLFIETLAELGHSVPSSTGIRSDTDMDAFHQAFRQRTAGEWLAAFISGDVPVEVIQPLGSVFRDPQAMANDYVVDLDDPVWGRARQVLAPYRSEPPPVVVSPAPALDEHHDAVRRDIARSSGPAAHPTTAVHVSERGSALLEGLRVLDFGMFLAGPYAPMLLADLGADVVKIEPTTGDRMRTFHQQQMFLACQRGKRSLALDLRHPESRPIVERLVRSADVVHHNIRLPAAKRLGIDYESLKALNPSLVYCHTNSYGPSGDKAGRPGYDGMAQAASGWQRAMVNPEDKPAYVRFAPMDTLCAMSSLVPTLMALYRRARTGQGGQVSASLLGAAVVTNSETMLLLDTDALAPVATINSDLTGLGPGYRNYRVAKGEWIAVAATTPEQLSALQRIAGVADPAQLANALANWDATTLLAELERDAIPSERVRCKEERRFFADELQGPSRLVASYPHPVYGTFLQPGSFWNFGNTPVSLDRPPPLLGEHTTEILDELGFDAEDIQRFEGLGVTAHPNVVALP